MAEEGGSSTDLRDAAEGVAVFWGERAGQGEEAESDPWIWDYVAERLDGSEREWFMSLARSVGELADALDREG